MLNQSLADQTRLCKWSVSLLKVEVKEAPVYEEPKKPNRIRNEIWEKSDIQ